MERVELGRTGLSVSVAGLGCGGHSRLGQGYGASVTDSVNVVRTALDEGVNYVDTAPIYRTEEIVGIALEGRRDEVVLSTKVSGRTAGGEAMGVAELRAAVESSLTKLQTEWIDVFHFHAVREAQYQRCADLVPELLALRDEGKIRYFALSEAFEFDLEHDMVQRALADDCWDVLMVGFNIFNQSARERVFQKTIEQNVGIEVMFAVRDVLSQPEALRQTITQCVDDGLVDGSMIDLDDPLGFLLYEGGAASVTEAAYRFARHEPGSHVVLTGTGNVEHLRANIAAVNQPPLPDVDRARLAELFGHLVHINGNFGRRLPGAAAETPAAT